MAGLNCQRNVRRPALGTSLALNELQFLGAVGRYLILNILRNIQYHDFSTVSTAKGVDV